MSYPVQAGSTDKRLKMVAVLDDFSTFKTDLVAADITALAVKRVAAADVTVSVNTDDTNPDDSHTDGNIYNAGGGEYLVSVPDAAVASGTTAANLYGTWTDGGDTGFLIGDTHPLVSYDWQSSDRSLTGTAITAIGTAFLSTTLTKGTAGTIERAFWQTLKSQAVTDGTAAADVGNTLTQFQTNLTAPDGQYDHMILVFVSNGLEGEARPIDTYVQANGVITLQESLTEIPTGDEEFIILPQHAHPISEIQAGLATQTKLLNYIRLLARKDAAVVTDLATELGEINADTGTGTGTYSNNDSQESIRDNAVNITPLSAGVEQRVNGTNITLYLNEVKATTISITDSEGTAIDLSALTLEIAIEDHAGTDIQVIADADITISGGSSNNATFTNTAAVTASERVLHWALRDITTGSEVLARGFINVKRAADGD